MYIVYVLASINGVWNRMDLNFQLRQSMLTKLNDLTVTTADAMHQISIAVAAAAGNPYQVNTASIVRMQTCSRTRKSIVK